MLSRRAQMRDVVRIHIARAEICPVDGLLEHTVHANLQIT